MLDAYSEAQRVASETFDRAQQRAAAGGADVKLSGGGSTLNVVVCTKVDGKSASLDLEKVVWVDADAEKRAEELEQKLRERTTEVVKLEEEVVKLEEEVKQLKLAAEQGGACCVVM